MTISNAKYADEDIIKATIDGAEMTIPASGGNRHYRRLLEAEAAGEITIEPYAPPTAEEELQKLRASWEPEAAQIQIALEEFGRLAEVEALVAASSRRTQIWWEKGRSINRLSPTLAKASKLMNPKPTEEWWDNVFRRAVEIET
ncbi:MAG: hypothetical protein FKY71_08680 [Spiribacter salinus]|uniref:Uncharacterized protein n=1 Tax=Spiribacter salinus TaxID=1335746 RepID=A0A540VRZ9_9GAMM|nr:MAG: hypothetical protein FKY71_08680 [Spiribacter salinus]